MVPPHREGGQAQFIERPLAQSTKDTQINALLDYLRDHLHEPQNIDEVAERVSMSRSTFTSHFKKATGMTFLEWLHKERLQRSLDLLENSGFSVEQIAEKTGFQNAMSFRQQFFKYYQVNPHAWRKMFRDEG